VILPQQGIQGLGQLPEFTKACFSMEAGEISAPVKTAKGYHIIRVDERGADYLLPLDEAKQDVISRLRMEKRQNVQGTLVAELKTKYNVVYVTDLGTLSPEDLFRLASEASNPREKIRYYEQFLQDYPDNERAYEAKFMIGFTYAEDLRNHAEAEKVFREFLEQYSDSDLGDDARWMLENMTSGEHPEFESEES
jgi:tetratricopeptide (TPR) repeat protein